MLVSEKHKKLVMKLKNPARVTGIIPGAKLLDYRGTQLVAVPHTHDVSRVLRNVGLAAPGTILHYYDWPSHGMTPFVHQKTTSEFATMNPRAYVLNDMGTGKTLSVGWAADHLITSDVVDWVLVLTPLSTLERTWADTLFEHLPHRSVGVVYGTAAKRLKVAKQDHQFYLLNHDGIKSDVLLNHFAKKPGRGLIVVDELTVMRHAKTERWKYLNMLINGDSRRGLAPKQYVWGLTGTPIPQEPTDVWAQCRLITPGTVPKWFTTFRDMTMRQITPYKWLPKPGGLEVAMRAMQPAIRFERSACIDLPPTTVVDRVAPLSPEQERMFDEMKATLKTTYEAGQLTALNEVTMLNKLIQITCGVAYTPDGSAMVIPSGPRLAVLEEIVEQASAKVIIFVPLVGALHSVAAHLRKRWGTAVVHGEVSKRDRDEIFSDFMTNPALNCIVAIPGTMSHGLTLTSANTVVWYGPPPSSEIYQQANARVTRPGQKLNTLIVRMHANTTVERERYREIDRREKTQKSFLELF
jgi:SNF2 family DNA or RNA helicase